MKHHDKLKDAASRLDRRTQTQTPETMPVSADVRVILDHLHAVNQNTRDQLSILRKTRGQREVGAVKIPAHLQVPDIIDTSGVESRGSLAPIKGV